MGKVVKDEACPKVKAALFHANVFVNTYPSAISLQNSFAFKPAKAGFINCVHGQFANQSCLQPAFPYALCQCLQRYHKCQALNSLEEPAKTSHQFSHLSFLTCHAKGNCDTELWELCELCFGALLEPAGAQCRQRRLVPATHPGSRRALLNYLRQRSRSWVSCASGDPNTAG